MLAKNLLMPSFDLEVVPANEYAKQVEPMAEYMHIDKKYTEILFPADLKEEDIEHGLRYTYYKIDGRLYIDLMINKINELERLYRNKNVQLTLF